MNEVNVKVYPAHHYRRVRWRNGAGWTREIVRMSRGEDGMLRPDAVAAAGDNWDARLSIAEIDRDCAFSAFPQFERELVLLRGDGIELDLGAGRVVVGPPHGRIHFKGAEAPSCRLVGGPTHDFNLMWRAQSLDAQLLHRPLVGSMVFFAGAGVAWAVYLISGRAFFKGRSELAPLQSGDCALIGCGDHQRGRALLDGGGETLLVRFVLPVG